MTASFQIFNEDCFETFARLPDKSVDLVLCDPPYGTTACKWDSVIPIDRMWGEIWRVVTDNAAVVMTAIQPFTTILVSSSIRQFKYEWVWIKTKPVGHLNAKKRPMTGHETVLVFSKGQTAYYPQGLTESGVSVSRTNNGAYGACSKTTVATHTGYPRSDSLKFSHDKSTGHPTQKPVALMEYLIKTYTNEGQTVLDFAMGSGTTGVACGNLNRNFIGCDSDTEHGYFPIAENRIKEAYENNRT